MNKGNTKTFPSTSTVKSSLKPLQTIDGLRIEVDEVVPFKVQLDKHFEIVPIAAAAGIPLVVKKIAPTGPFKVKSPEHPYRIVRIMSDPRLGLAAEPWQDWFSPLPPVLMCRTDGVPFSDDDFYALDIFEINMLDDGPRNVTRDDFIEFAEGYGQEGIEGSDATIILEAVFPQGTKVKIQGLKNRKELNGRFAEVNGKYINGRVGVQLDGAIEVAVKMENLKKRV